MHLVGVAARLQPGLRTQMTDCSFYTQHVGMSNDDEWRREYSQKHIKHALDFIVDPPHQARIAPPPPPAKPFMTPSHVDSEHGKAIPEAAATH